MAETTWDYTIQDFSPLIVYAGSNAGSIPLSNLDPNWRQSCPVELLGTSNHLCDVSSTHTTSVPGARFSFPFYGQSIQLIGNVTGGMEYDVNVDGSTLNGTPSGQLLARITDLAMEHHTVTLTAKPSLQDFGGVLLFTKAIVTVGTGLTGATVIRTEIQDNYPLLEYVPTWTTVHFADSNISYTPPNSTYHQLDDGRSGSFTLPFSGDAIMIYGLAKSFSSSAYRITLDANPPETHFSNSTLPDLTPGLVYVDGLLYFQANLSHDTHYLTFDNNNGTGFAGLDYIEVVSVTGGSPLSGNSSSTPSTSSTPSGSSSRHSSLVKLIVAHVFGILAVVLLVVALSLYWCRWRRRRKQRQHNITPIPFEHLPSPITAPTSTKTIDISPNFSTIQMNGMGSPVMHPEMSPTSGRAKKGQGSANGSGNGNSSTAEIVALRRDVQQLLQIVGRPGGGNSTPPPEYA